MQLIRNKDGTANIVHEIEKALEEAEKEFTVQQAFLGYTSCKWLHVLELVFF